VRAFRPFGSYRALIPTSARTAGKSAQGGTGLPGNTRGARVLRGTADGSERRALVHMTAADVSRTTDLEEPMTLKASAPEQGLITDLPATLAGLWTAITMTHDIADALVATHDPGVSAGLSAIAAACAEAADSLAVSRPEALCRAAELPVPRNREAVEGLPLVSAMASGCIDLAIDVLGNEAEPLSPVEVLAVTRAVTALCAARSLAQGCAP
jgi:hypothetical protein